MTNIKRLYIEDLFKYALTLNSQCYLDEKTQQKPELKGMSQGCQNKRLIVRNKAPASLSLY